MNIKEHVSSGLGHSHVSDKLHSLILIAAAAFVVLEIWRSIPELQAPEQITHLIAAALAPTIAFSAALFILSDALIIRSRMLRWGYMLSAVILLMEVLFVIRHWFK